ncbi:hypothetical protein AVEN_260874-1 [Araneus ventricosus]|uniref:Uncharacterized protein n=1 Tax=Araneus ventricosus TaxID=182803 RepID=A0A4Y2LQ96_ARAVE|nr:hypothetical protein AVEN_260874-1 [Araneus ventricosus]
MLEEWQTLWKNGDTGRKIYNIMPSVSLSPANWIRDDVIFFSQYGPFPAYLKRFHLSGSDYCSCGGIVTLNIIVTNMESRFPAMLALWLGREFDNVMHGVTGSGYSGIPDFGDKLGDLGDKSMISENTTLFSISLLVKGIRLNLQENSM